MKGALNQGAPFFIQQKIFGCDKIMKLVYIFTLLCSLTLLSSNATDSVSYKDCLRKAYQAQSVYKVEEAEHWFREALRLDPSDPAVRLALARTLFAQLKNTEALDQVQKVLGQHPQNAEAHYFLCRYYWKIDKNIEKAKNHGELANEYDSNHIGAKTLLGEIYISEHSYNKAESIYRELLEIDKNLNNAYVGLGNALIKQETYEEGIQVLQKAIKKDPKNPAPHRILATAYAKIGQREKAREEQKLYQTLKSNLQRIENLLRDLHTDPENAQRWFDLGKEYIRQRYPVEKAIEAIKKGLHFDFKQAEMHNLIGTLYLNVNQLNPAKKHLKYAVSLAPEDANIYNNLGVACLLNQDFKEAVKYLSKSIELGNNDPGVKQNLKIAKMKLQEKDL